MRCNNRDIELYMKGKKDGKEELQERIDRTIKYINSYCTEFGELVHYGDSLDPHELISLLNGKELDDEGGE